MTTNLDGFRCKMIVINHFCSTSI